MVVGFSDRKKAWPKRQCCSEFRTTTKVEKTAYFCLLHKDLILALIFCFISISFSARSLTSEIWPWVNDLSSTQTFSGMQHKYFQWFEETITNNHHLLHIHIHWNNEVRWTCHSPTISQCTQADRFEELPTSASWGPHHDINSEGFTSATGIGMI